MAEKGKGRSLKDRLVDMGVLVEKDEPQGETPGSAQAPTLGASASTAPSGGVDRDMLKQLLASATKETNDYTEFMLSADAMSGVIPDESTRMRAAFVASKPHGLTLDRILAGLASSKQALDAKRREFEKVLSQKVDALVTTKQRQADDNRRAIDSKRQQLAQLQADITSLEQVDAQLKADINAGQTQIEAAKTNFLAAYNAAVAVLSSNEAKLRTQLKGA